MELCWLEVGPWDCRRGVSRPRCLRRHWTFQIDMSAAELTRGPVINHLNPLLEPLSCSGGFSGAHGPSEAHRKTEEGHSSPAPGYLGNIDRVINKMI